MPFISGDDGTGSQEDLVEAHRYVDTWSKQFNSLTSAGIVHRCCPERCSR
ncbi:MAG: hypothetical protein JKY37_00430 [Nannocystaceae bacterium]|nr:hypothetical protein [Nannocystaceae bacterium]